MFVAAETARRQALTAAVVVRQLLVPDSFAASQLQTVAVDALSFGVFVAFLPFVDLIFLTSILISLYEIHYHFLLSLLERSWF